MYESAARNLYRYSARRNQRNVSVRSAVRRVATAGIASIFEESRADRPLVNTAISPFFLHPSTPETPFNPPSDVEWRTLDPPFDADRERARANMNRRPVKWYRMERRLSRCIAGSRYIYMYGRATIKTSGPCRKLLKWHSARACHKRPWTLIRSLSFIVPAVSLSRRLEIYAALHLFFSLHTTPSFSARVC